MKVDYNEAKRLIDNENAQFIDVRTPDEYAELGILGSVNMPLQRLLELHALILDHDKDRPIVLYCRSGNRSNTALNQLAELGYTRLYDMGSYLDWQG